MSKVFVLIEKAMYRTLQLNIHLSSYLSRWEGHVSHALFKPHKKGISHKAIHTKRPRPGGEGAANYL